MSELAKVVVTGDDEDSSGSLGERRDHDADRRDHDARNRDLADGLRDRLARQRDKRANQRDLNGEQRDLNGEQRDLDAERRDRQAGRRDFDADQRDREAELRDTVGARIATGASPEADRFSALREQAALDRRKASSDRAEAATERDQAELDRGTAHADRVAGASGRDSSELDRGTALADRVAGASGRDSAETDRDTAMNDRAASATDRHYAAQLASSLQFGWTVSQLEPPEFLYVSPGYLRILGLPPTRSDLTLARSLAMVHPDDVVPVSQYYWNPATPGATVESEVRIVRADGEIRWIRSISSPVIDADGVVVRTAATVEDVTARKDAEAAVRLAQQNAERANAAKSEFLSRMSHELRTPLNSVLGFAQLLDLDPLTPPQRSAVSHILRGGRLLLGMIEDVLDMSRIDTRQLNVALEPVHVGNLAVEVVTLMRPVAASNQVEIHPDAITFAADFYVLADRHRLRQVLLQLLSNAVKYNQPNGCVKISCALYADQGELRLSVTDTGCGIRAAELPGLFIPFERITEKRSDIEGTGIGLALSSRLISIMGGRLEVESEFGVGSTFSVVMPVAEAPPPGG